MTEDHSRWSIEVERPGEQAARLSRSIERPASIQNQALAILPRDFDARAADCLRTAMNGDRERQAGTVAIGRFGSKAPSEPTS